MLHMRTSAFDSKWCDSVHGQSVRAKFPGPGAGAMMPFGVCFRFIWEGVGETVFEGEHRPHSQADVEKTAPVAGVFAFARSLPQAVADPNFETQLLGTCS